MFFFTAMELIRFPSMSFSTPTVYSQSAFPTPYGGFEDDRKFCDLFKVGCLPDRHGSRMGKAVGIQPCHGLRFIHAGVDDFLRVHRQENAGSTDFILNCTDFFQFRFGAGEKCLHPFLFADLQQGLNVIRIGCRRQDAFFVDKK